MMTFLTRLIVCVLMAPLPCSAGQLGFELPTLSGSVRVQPDQSKATVVCFLGAECPMARSYAITLNELHKTYAAKGVRVVGVFSNRQDSLADLANYAEQLNVEFPIAHDVGNLIADRYAATRTPEVFLLDEQLKLRYHGRIDDRLSPGVARTDATREDLRIAIDELLAGKPIAIKETRALGCIIGKVKTSAEKPEAGSVTYSKDIAPLIQRNCLECHRDGEIGPFAMDDYDEVVGWAETMLETIENGRMPPWHAEPGYRELANARHMSEQDKELFRAWVQDGLPEGDAADLPPVVTFTEGWQLPREPDLIVEMRSRPFPVPKDGVVEYQYFVADLDFEEDRWISAAQVIPGSRAVVHHAIAFIRPPDGSRFRGIGWLSAYVPGQRMRPLPPGRARKIPAGSKLVFQMHYTPIGIAQQDLTKVGLIFADPASVTHEVYTLVGIDQEFEIPPGDSNYVVQARVPWLPEEGELLAVTPHMHFRGKAFQLFDDSSREETILSVPQYDFNWQHTYQFSNPIDVRDIEVLNFDAVFDNSADNPFNPAPDEWVAWGDQTWEEMAVAFFEVAEPLEPARVSRTQTAFSQNSSSDLSLARESRQAKIDQYISKFLKELDKNGDGRIKRSETGIVLRRWNFEFWDDDGDDVVTVDELRKVAESLYP